MLTAIIILWLVLLTNYFNSLKSNSLSKYKNLVNEINSFEPEISKLSNEELQNKTNYFKNKLKNKFTEKDILAEVFAVVREVAKEK